MHNHGRPYTPEVLDLFDYLPRQLPCARVLYSSAVNYFRIGVMCLPRHRLSYIRLDLRLGPQKYMTNTSLRIT